MKFLGPVLKRLSSLSVLCSVCFSKFDRAGLSIRYIPISFNARRCINPLNEGYRKVMYQIELCGWNGRFAKRVEHVSTSK